MKIVITNGSSVPLYEQIKQQIKDNILQGELPPDEQLPSIRELSRNLKVSILTVKKAFDELEAEGYLLVKQGLGTFVAPQNPALAREEKQKELESHLIAAVQIAQYLEMEPKELQDLLSYLYTSEIKE